MGSNQENARLSGINVHRVKLLAYVLSGFFTSLAGVIWTARLGIGSPIGGYGYELESIACVVVGLILAAVNKGLVRWLVPVIHPACPDCGPGDYPAATGNCQRRHFCYPGR